MLASLILAEPVMFSSLMMFAPLVMFPKLMTKSVISVGIPITIIVVRVVIITIPGIVPCTTCQHKPECDHYSP